MPPLPRAERTSYEPSRAPTARAMSNSREGGADCGGLGGLASVGGDLEAPDVQGFLARHRRRCEPRVAAPVAKRGVHGDASRSVKSTPPRSAARGDGGPARCFPIYL